jgi:hypothetical protein
MGLLFVLPVSLEEGDRVEVREKTLILKSYGLPMIFWSYLSGIFIIVFAMGLAIKDPLLRLYHTQDIINKMLALSCGFVLTALPLALLLFFFYEKRIHKKNDELTLEKKLFGITFWKTKKKLESKEALEIGHFMDSPNMAKIHNDPDLRGFQNKGYFELFAKLKDGKSILVDRSSRKADLKKLQEILKVY